MSPRASRLLAWGLFGIGVVLLLAQLPLVPADDQVARDYFNPLVGAILATVTLLWLATGALIISRQPRNWAGWIFCLVGLAVPFNTFAQAYAVYGLKANPGGLPLVGIAAWLNEYGLYPVALVPLLFLLFPDGKPPSARWRWAVAGLVGGTAVAIAAFLVRPGTFNNLRSFGIQYDNPWGIEALRSVAGGIIAMGTIVALVASLSTVVALRQRFKRSSSEERQQLRWLVFVASIAGVFFALMWLVTILGDILFPHAIEGGPQIFPILLGLCAATVALGVPAAYGVAILKYRLYELDLFVKKTVVFGVLAVFISAVYALVVGGIGALVGSHSSTALSFAAAALLAVAFQPARDRAQRLADRVVYGKRATPYEVLSEFSGRLAETYSTDEVLPQTVRILGEGTGAASARVWLRVGGELRAAASWPRDAGDAPPVRMIGDALPEMRGAHAVEVRHQGELLGALSVTMPADDPMNPSRERLVRDLAAQAGLVLRNVRLIEELRASRQRLVAAQDQERRKIERNIHDGAQQQLVALSVQLKLVEATIEKDVDQERRLVLGLQVSAGEALENLRDLARGIYPSLLADRGLTPALDAQARKAPFPTIVEADGVGRYPEEVEAAVYFCALEAMSNVAKYANASHAVVRLAAENGLLTFTVQDDGDGFDPARTGYGTGLQGMADRLDAIGGELEIRSSPGSGTMVIGRIPLAAVAGTVSVERGKDDGA